jgi:hypothetical protein
VVFSMVWFSRVLTGVPGFIWDLNNLDLNIFRIEQFLNLNFFKFEQFFGYEHFSDVSIFKL